jgi:hypothetical protein
MTIYCQSVDLSCGKFAIPVFVLGYPCTVLIRNENDPKSLEEHVLSDSQSAKIKHLTERYVHSSRLEDSRLRYELMQMLKDKTTFVPPSLMKALEMAYSVHPRDGLATMPVKADNEAGYALINAIDFDPMLHEGYEPMPEKVKTKK